MVEAEFKNIKNDEYFMFGTMLMFKTKGTAKPLKNPRDAMDYNAVDASTGDVWEMDEDDKVIMFTDED